MSSLPRTTMVEDAAPGRGMPRLNTGTLGLVMLAVIAAPCLLTLPWSLSAYDHQRLTGDIPLSAPSWSEPFGTDLLGRSLLWRCLLGGAISLTIGTCAAGLAVFIGVSWGMVAGFAGGRVDAAMMRIVDVLYGLPYILLVVLIDLGLQPVMERTLGLFMGSNAAGQIANVVTLLIAIGSVSWLTMARVIRGQVLSLRAQPFIESARAIGVGRLAVLRRHLLPNLVGPIVVYATLAVPQAILQESFLSFLGIGVADPLPSWGNLASAGLGELYTLVINPSAMKWWLLVVPCVLLGLTLMALNFLGDGLRDRLDPRSRRR